MWSTPAGPRSAASLQIRSDAQRELAELEPTIPSVTIDVDGVSPSEAFEVAQDGRPLPRALVGVAHPVNPGEHTWRVNVGARPAVAETRSIEAGATHRIVL